MHIILHIILMKKFKEITSGDHGGQKIGQSQSNCVEKNLGITMLQKSFGDMLLIRGTFQK